MDFLDFNKACGLWNNAVYWRHWFANAGFFGGGRMKKFVLIPDSFKGTMSSSEVCAVMADSIKKFEREARIVSVPVADGGEGSVAAFLAACAGKKIAVSVSGPFFDAVPSFYGMIDDGKTAVIEMAAAAGLPLAEGRLNPQKTTTFGVGSLIKAALDGGAQKIIVGLGGSATNDGGTGMAAALGVEFYDKAGAKFVPVGGTLKDICRIDTHNLDPRLKKTRLVTMCDIDNPLFGKNGAAYIFGPQKGADEQSVRILDEGLTHLADIVKRDMGADYALMSGAGAAGGMGYGMKVFLDAEIQMGIETVLDAVKFDELVKGAACVFTGEGKIDSQSLRGKVIIGVARRAKKEGVPLVAVVGDIGDNIDEAYELGVSAVFSINRVAVDYSRARLRAKSDLALTMENIMRFSKIF
jgi:glycerate kinase